MGKLRKTRPAVSVWALGAALAVVLGCGTPTQEPGGGSAGAGASGGGAGGSGASGGGSGGSDTGGGGSTGGNGGSIGGGGASSGGSGGGPICGTGGVANARFVPTAGDLMPMRSAHAAALLNDGRVLITGGETPDRTILSSAEIYVPAADAFQPVVGGSLREWHQATVLLDGRVLITGGNDTTGALATTQIFDPATMRFTAGPDLVHARTQHTATRLADGRVLVVGGKNVLPSEPFAGKVTDIEVYDPARNSFIPVCSGANGIARHAATQLANGRVLITGGETVDDPSGLGEELELNGLTLRTAATARLLMPRSRHQSTLLVDGTVLITGGMGEVIDANADFLSQTATAELYDAASPSFFSVGKMRTERSGHQATLLTDGRVLITGGEGVDEDSNAFSEIYDPTTRTFTLGPMANGARQNHSSTRLRDGRVLLVGGIQPFDPPGPGAELFLP